MVNHLNCLLESSNRKESIEVFTAMIVCMQQLVVTSALDATKMLVSANLNFTADGMSSLIY